MLRPHRLVVTSDRCFVGRAGDGRCGGSSDGKQAADCDRGRVERLDGDRNVHPDPAEPLDHWGRDSGRVVGEADIQTRSFTAGNFPVYAVPLRATRPRTSVPRTPRRRSSRPAPRRRVAQHAPLTEDVPVLILLLLGFTPTPAPHARARALPDGHRAAGAPPPLPLVVLVAPARLHDPLRRLPRSPWLLLLRQAPERRPSLTRHAISETACSSVPRCDRRAPPGRRADLARVRLGRAQHHPWTRPSPSPESARRSTPRSTSCDSSSRGFRRIPFWGVSLYDVGPRGQTTRYEVFLVDATTGEGDPHLRRVM